MKIDFATVVRKIDALLKRGLSKGLGDRNGQMCIEAVICAALDLPHGDNPADCVDQPVRAFKITLNDSSNWQSPESRAAGLRDLGIAQLGSKGVVNSKAFSKRLAEKTIRILIPRLFREVFPDNTACLAAADLCESEGSATAASAAADASYKAYKSSSCSTCSSSAAHAAAAAAYAAADAAAEAAHAAANPVHSASGAASGAAAHAAAYAANAAYAAAQAAQAANAAAEAESFLRLGASLALETLQELRSPGCEWI